MENNAELFYVAYVDLSTTPTPTAYRHVMSEGKEVCGVASLGDVFVVYGNVQQRVEVYDAKTFEFQRHITVPGLGEDSTGWPEEWWCPSVGLAACPDNNCLYASDHNRDSIHRVDMASSNAVMKWSVALWPVGLSVNAEHNLIVVSEGERKLQIFTTHGTLIQNIQLQAGIDVPRHAVQLLTSQFLVTDAKYIHRVCLVGVDGAVVRSYDTYEDARSNPPSGLTVDRLGRVLAAYRGNRTLLMLDQSLQSARKTTIDISLCSPLSLWYDRSRGRLYVGEKEGALVVIDNLKDFRDI